MCPEEAKKINDQPASLTDEELNKVAGGVDHSADFPEPFDSEQEFAANHGTPGDPYESPLKARWPGNFGENDKP